MFVFCCSSASISNSMCSMPIEYDSRLARVMTNAGFNDIMEATLIQSRKPTPTSSMEERYEFIRAKYVEKKFAVRTSVGSSLLSDLEHAVISRHIYELLQVFVEGADLMSVLPSSMNGETSLHTAISQEDGTSLHIIDFIVQNSSMLDKETKDGNTPLHFCAMYNRSESMKLLLRSGANPNIENAEEKTPIDIAREKGYHICQELLSHALQKKKELFENVSVEWGLTQDDGLTDVSDDEVDEKVPTVGSSTPEKRLRSRPPSFAAADSPCIRSRASTAESCRSDSSPVLNRNSVVPPSPPPQNKKPVIPGLNSQGSIKKRAAPPPPVYSQGHNRTPSDPVISNSFSSHKRTPSTDSAASACNVIATLPPKVPLSTSLPNSLGPKVLIPASSDFCSLKNMNDSSLLCDSNSLLRPKAALPRRPPSLSSGNLQTMTNGESIESLCSNASTSSDFEATPAQEDQLSAIPAPPPRKRPDLLKPRRCRALYDCDADNEDELSFQEGEVIIILNEQTEDENWMEGVVEGHSHRKGMFPVSFVHMLSD